MASKTQNSSKTSSASRTSASKKASATRARNKAKQKAKRQLTAIALFAVGLFAFALCIVEGQNVWSFFHNGIFGLFGLCAWLVGPALVYIAVLLAMDKPNYVSRTWQVSIFLVLLCACFTVFSGINFEGLGFAEGISTLYTSGTALKGGGFVSCLLGWPLIALFGDLGAKITICILLFVFVMIITGATLYDLLHSASKPVKKLEEAYTGLQEVRTEREAKRVENLKARFDIDVPIDEPSKKKGREKPAPTLQELLNEKPQEPVSSLDEPELPTWRREQYLDANPVNSIQPPQEEHESIDEIVARRTGGFTLVPENTPVVPSYDTPGQAPVANAPKEDGLPAEGAEENGDTDGQTPPEQPPYQFPPIDLLKEGRQGSNKDITRELKENAQRLVDVLKSFGVQTRVIDISRGPAVTRYELQPSAGVKISKITGLADDIALNLAAAGVRIEAPIPNKAAVGIEVPNQNVETVTIREIISSSEFENSPGALTVSLGRDIAGNATVADLAKMPHLLIAGATGSGKSVCVNSFIVSLLYKSSPQDVKLIMIDPKVVELGVYNGIPHLLVPVVTDPRKAAGTLNWAVTEMLNRYKIFAENGVRDLKGYNELCTQSDTLHKLPYIVIIIDELADLMMAAPSDVEDAICRLAQMARAAGMHLVIATQRPSVDVITGVIKANIPSRIAFAVSSQVDSRTILDQGGAEKLLGRGDMLYYPVGAPKPQRIQGTFVGDSEIEHVVKFIKEQVQVNYDQNVMEEIEKRAVATEGGKKSAGGADAAASTDDQMLPDAIECVVEAGVASTSLLQRRLKLGYARAARIIDEMESRGIVGPFEGSKPRQVLISRQQWMEMKMRENEQGASQQE